MGYKATDKCIEKAFDDEKLFILMARDFTAPETVIEWIKLNIHKQPTDKLREAFECALHMKDTNTEVNLRKNYPHCEILTVRIKKGIKGYWYNKFIGRAMRVISFPQLLVYKCIEDRSLNISKNHCKIIKNLSKGEIYLNPLEVKIKK